MTKKTEEKLKLLIEFHETKGRWPYARECYKGINIGNFARNVIYNKIKLNNYYYNILLEKEFFTSILHKKILILLEFLNTNKRYPYSDEIYRDFNIYRFATSIKNGKLDDKLSKDDKKSINENIYFNSTYRYSIYHKRILLLIEFFNLYGRWPRINEPFKNTDIGTFAYYVRIHNIIISNQDENLLREKGFIFK